MIYKGRALASPLTYCSICKWLMLTLFNTDTGSHLQTHGLIFFLLASLIKVNGETPDTWVTPDSHSSCSESVAADTSTGKERCMRRWGSFPSGGGVGGGRFAVRAVAVRSYPRVWSSPHLPYIQVCDVGTAHTDTL